ncbi:MAG TPA: glycosyltransferase, partial [Stellaceae bacterium]|nr:glycosyltransferase [Stellaceae bacterium]
MADRSAPDESQSAGLPPVSVLTFCRNGAATIRRAVESIVHQSYPNIQYVVQDGASTDGTLAILAEYGDKVDLLSEPDRGAHDAFFRGFLRCKGEIIVVCSADEALMPCAIERAVQEFTADPDLGALTGDGYYWNDAGNIFHIQAPGAFNLLAYLLGTYCPNFSASFFRRAALEGLGFFAERWKSGALESVEFEIWCRLGSDHKIKYVPYIFSKYGIADAQLSQNVGRIIDELNARLMIIRKFLFSLEGFFGNDEELRDLVIEKQFRIIIQHLTAYRRHDDAARVQQLMEQELQSGRESRLGKLMDAAVVSEADRLGSIRLSDRILFALRRATPRRIAVGMSLELKQKIRTRLNQTSLLAYGLARKSLGRIRSTGNLVSLGAVRDAQMYHRVAELYRWRGQVEEAWALWQHTDILRNEIIASDGCQVVLKSPYKSDADLAVIQRRWAEHYAKPNLTKLRYAFPKRASGERLTIGYYCSFWHGEGIRAHALSFIEKHDRTAFKVIGYSPYEVPQVAPMFETFKYTGMMSNDDFVDLVRKDGVDIFIDLSGMSDRHRLGAMASRCAPVQVSYINHPAPVCVPNIDYVIANAIAAPPQSDIHYPEE